MTVEKKVQYAELHCKTNFSFLEGASHAAELVERAKQLGYHALAATDRNTLAGIVRAHGAAKDQQLKLVVGAEIHLQDGPSMVVWPTDRAAYGRLCRLLTVGRRRAPKGECHLLFDDVASHSEGLIAGLLPPDPAAALAKSVADPQKGVVFPGVVEGRRLREAPPRSGDRGYGVSNVAALAKSVARREDATPNKMEPALDTFYANAATGSANAATDILKFRELFGERGYLLGELFRGPDDEQRLQRLAEMARQSRLPLVAAGDVHYHVAARMPLHDVITCIRHGTTIHQAEGLLFPNAQRHLKTVDEIAARFARFPDALRRTIEIADACRFSLDELRYEYPEELAPAGYTPMEYLRYLAWKGADRRYPGGIPDKVRGLLEHELALIAELRYEAYFLTVWDLVRFARSRGILCQGRGSAANSSVCFCLGVTSVDPSKTDLLFERFISRERNEAPDIDIDFEHERREEVLQYLYEKYGRERAGLTAVVITYRSRSAIRDVGKALGLSLDSVDNLAKQVETFHFEPRLAQRMREAGLDPESEVGRRFVHLAKELEGFPRHLSQHVGGMVMTRGPLCELSPIENAAMEGRTVIEWDKDDLDELGILKVDCLCLGMLSAIRKCFELVARHHDHHWTLATLPAEDPHVYEAIQHADTMGVFQIESRAQMSMLPRLKPKCWYDLVIEVAIVRPGPIQGQMVHPYLRRRNGEEQVSYPTPEIRDVLHKTLGVPIFQEQAMRLAVVAAGFTPGEADQLRRAMGAWRRPGIIEQFRVKLIEGMRSRGLSDEFAEHVFSQIRGFGEYGFPESHAASFALLVYVSAWLKVYYPAEYLAAILNSQPMGFYAPAQLVRDAREHGVEIRPIDVQRSDWDCTLEPSELPVRGEAPWKTSSKQRHAPQWRTRTMAVRLGMRLLTGFRRDAAEAIVQARTAGPFNSIDDFAARTRLNGSSLKRLAEADALASLEQDRRAALWRTLAYEGKPREVPLFAGEEHNEAPPPLPPMPMIEKVFADYRHAGLSLTGHPIAFFRKALGEKRAIPARHLATTADGARVRVAGIVLLRQRPQTAKGITFVTLEDETGAANLVVRPNIWERFYNVARRSPAWLAHGKLERKGIVIHVVVDRIEDLSTALGTSGLKAIDSASRDFR